ncbi:MAG: hypothetical protein ACYCVZ_06610 [Streptosporangiaceae bacterium]
MKLVLLMALAAVWLTMAVILVLDLSSIRRSRTWSRLAMCASLVGVPSVAVPMVGDYRFWSPAAMRDASHVQFALALLAVAITVLPFARRLARRTRPPHPQVPDPVSTFSTVSRAG